MMCYRSLLALACVLIVGVSQANATILGVTVEDETSKDVVGSVDSNDQTIYYIPLSSAFSGDYGVTPVTGGTAGTVADTGSGYGYDPASALQMYFRYDLEGESIPSGGTTISFEFVDLDLDGVEDPDNFFESVQFTYFDDTGSAVVLTDTLTVAADGFGTVAAGVTADISYSGKNDPVSINFSGAGFTSIVNDVADAAGTYEDVFYMRLSFGSKYTHSATNTSEKLLTSALTVEAVQEVPEPTALAIWSVLGGIGLVAGHRRRKRKAT